MAKAEKDIKPIIKSYFTIIPRQDAVRKWEFEEIHIDPVIELNGIEEDSLQSQTVLKAVTKLIDRVAKDETKELPQRIGVTYTMNPQKKGYCLHIQGTPKTCIDKNLVQLYFLYEKMESVTERGLNFDDMMEI